MGIMYEGIFSTLTRAVEGTAIIAVAASLVWGILSILLSPCHLASIPLIVAFVNGQGRPSTGRACAVSSLFAGGILVTIGVIGAVTAAAGRVMGDIGAYGSYLVAAVFFLVGLHFLDVIPMPWSGPGQAKMKQKGLLASFVLGLVFGIALGPCTFAFMAPVLGVAFRLASTSPAYGVLLLAAYGVGHCSVIVFAGTSTGLVQRYLDWNERSRGAVALRRICGVLVILGGLYLVLQPVIPGRTEAPAEVTAEEGLPCLQDFGMGSCVACKMMVSVLEELRTQYAGVLAVEYVDIGEHPNAGRIFKIRQIPAQIFYDASGKEIYRHTGFIATEDIIAKFAELGVRLEPSGQPDSAPAAGPTPAPDPTPAKPNTPTEPAAQQDASLPKGYTGTVVYMFHSDPPRGCAMQLIECARRAIDEHFSTQLKDKTVL
jgi:cytochrome c-type biogenesis protein